MSQATGKPAGTDEREVVGQSGLPGQGPWLRLLLEYDGQKFTAARFETYGCPTAWRCGDWVCRWVTGRTPEQAKALESPDLIAVLGGVPLGKEFCADLATGALRSALDQIASSRTMQ